MYAWQMGRNYNKSKGFSFCISKYYAYNASDAAIY